jgi:hypothetical protein
MWRRACLGDRDAVMAAGYLWAGWCVALLVVVAARTSWWTGVCCSLLAAAALQAAYWWRRRRWDRWIRRQGLEGVTAVEALLRQRRSQG